MNQYLFCSCFSGAEKSNRCNNPVNRFQDSFGNKIGEGPHKVLDVIKGGCGNIKENYQNE